jgi:hypothetical protein
MGCDFSYRINGEKEYCTLYNLNISRHNHFLSDIVLEDTRFTYDELYEEISNILDKLRVADEDRSDIAEALRVLISVYSEMGEDDFVLMDYC